MYLKRKPVFTIENLLKRLKYLVFITNSSTFVKSVERLNKLMLSKMRQYTTPEQTAKLIELGFEKPKTIVDKYYDYDAEAYAEVNYYSIGELLSLLPISFEIENDITVWLEIEAGIGWSVLYSYCGFAEYECEEKELIDALFDMILKLKKEGVI